MNNNLNESEIKIKLSFGKIMTSDVVFYDDSFEAECAKYCRKRNITYLPSLDDFDLCYRFFDNKFQEERIDESQKVSVDDDIFDKSVVEKFEAHQVLFVFEKKELVGVVHFSDYNRNSVFIYTYSLLLAFEKGLRELLICSRLGNEEMMEFFKGNQENNDYYKKQFEYYSDPKIKEDMKELETFQAFYLKDLIGLTNSKKILKISESVNNDIRNIVMHAKNPVRHEDYEVADFIYNIESFKKFFESIKLLQPELRRVINKNRIKKELLSHESPHLRHASRYPPPEADVGRDSRQDK